MSTISSVASITQAAAATETCSITVTTALNATRRRSATQKTRNEALAHADGQFRAQTLMYHDMADTVVLSVLPGCVGQAVKTPSKHHFLLEQEARHEDTHVASAALYEFAARSILRSK